jgi:antibiotic biosynthesis monooxygenase (ABM) superfamily enzyme
MKQNAKCILVVTAEVDPEKEEAWNEWYNKKHLPDILECPGWYEARRYRRIAGDGGTQYIAIYVVENERIFESELFKQRAGWGEFEGFVKNVTNTFYYEVYQTAR